MFKKEILHIKSNPSMNGFNEIFHDVVYSSGNNFSLTMDIIVPWHDINSIFPAPRLPLIIFVQGSGWTFPNVWYQMPQLCEFAKKGYVIASITHRNADNGFSYPSSLVDVKTAIKFLRQNADKYYIDSEHIGLFGTSSGANLSILAAMTCDDLSIYDCDSSVSYDTDFLKISEKVNFVVSCFPTTDMVELYKAPNFDKGIKHIFDKLAYDDANAHMDILKKMSPYYITNPDDEYPPMLIAHGTNDSLIPYSQSLKLYEKMISQGHYAEMIAVDDAPHEGSFWSSEILEIIFKFIKANI